MVEGIGSVYLYELTVDDAFHLIVKLLMIFFAMKLGYEICLKLYNDLLIDGKNFLLKNKQKPGEKEQKLNT